VTSAGRSAGSAGAAVEPAEEQFRRYPAHAVRVLGHHRDPRPQHVGQFEIVEGDQSGPVPAIPDGPLEHVATILIATVALRLISSIFSEEGMRGR
jgi:hypothetical protein